MAATFTRSAMLPSDNIAQSDGVGSPPFEDATFTHSTMLPLDNMDSRLQLSPVLQCLPCYKSGPEGSQMLAAGQCRGL